MIYFIVMIIIITIILNLRLIIIVYIYLAPNNFRLIIYTINICCDIQIKISMRLIPKLEKVLHMYNFPLCILLPDYGCCTGEPKRVA